MTIRVRPFKRKDSEFILSLVARFSEFELPEWREAEEIDSTNHRFLEKTLKQPEPDSAIFVAEDETGELAGFIHLQTQTDYFNGEKAGYLSDVAVGKAFEGRGVGRLLMERADAWAREKGYRYLSLYVFAGNSRAAQLYEKCGYRPEVVKYVKVIEKK